MPSKNEINKVLYQSWHRGCKETDLILGDYATTSISNFSQDKFEQYKKLILESDWDIYNWVIEKEEIPSQYHELIMEIREFSLKKFT